MVPLKPLHCVTRNINSRFSKSESRTDAATDLHTAGRSQLTGTAGTSQNIHCTGLTTH